MVKDKSLLDDLLCNFFLQYRTINRKTKKKQLPKNNTVVAVRSHLKNYMLRNNDKLDISIETDFPRFSLFWKGFVKELKSKGNILNKIFAMLEIKKTQIFYCKITGLGDTTHNKALPKEHLTKINELLVLIHQIMIGQPFLIDESREPPVKTRNPKFDDLLRKFPKVLNENGKKNLN